MRLLLFNKLIINGKTLLKSGRDRDSRVKKGGMAGLTGEKWAGKRELRTLLWTLLKLVDFDNPF